MLGQGWSLGGYTESQMRLVLRVIANANSKSLWGEAVPSIVEPETQEPHYSRMQLELLLRKALDAALADALEEDYCDPRRVLNGGDFLPISLRIARVLRSTGLELARSTVEKWGDGRRRRLMLEDFIDGSLLTIGHRNVMALRVNDQAREVLVKAMFDIFHAKKVVLRRSGVYRTIVPAKSR